MHCVFMPNTQLCPALVAQYPFVVWSLYSLEDTSYLSGHYLISFSEGKSQPRQGHALHHCQTETPTIFPPA